MPYVTREQLKSIEYAGDIGCECPVCASHYLSKEHTPECWLGRALATPDEPDPRVTREFEQLNAQSD